MDNDSNLVKARASIVWMLAIVVAFGAVAWIEKESGKPLVAPAAATAARDPLPASADLPALPGPRALSAQEKAWAATAWAYFDRQTDAQTGLAGAVAGFPSASLWDMASGLLATIAARELEVIDEAAFDDRMRRALASLAKLPLYAGALPNKSYDVRSLAMTDYAGQPSSTGIGWSAIDVGRLLVPLNIIVWRYPRHTDAARAVIARWDTSRLVQGGQLFGMQAAAGGAAPQATQEGRLGYEQYAARTLALMGLDVDVAASWRDHLRLVDVDGVQVPVDTRDPSRFGAQDFVVSEPYMLAGLEFGWDRHAREAAWRVYRAQETRFRKTGVLTAVTEDHVDQAPYFVYNTVHDAGRNWVAVTDKGEDASKLRSLSTKAAFAWHALYRNEYTARLVQAVAPLAVPGQGWYAGLYEQGGTPNKALAANTNAVVLESLAYIARGPMLAMH